MKLTKSLFAAAALVTALSAGVASADDTVPGHPRVNEVQNRIDNQQNRVAAQETSGKITPTQAAKDDTKLTNESQRLSTDEAKNGGHITKREDKHLNRSLNKGNRIDRRQVKKDAAAQ